MSQDYIHDVIFNIVMLFFEKKFAPCNRVLIVTDSDSSDLTERCDIDNNK